MIPQHLSNCLWACLQLENEAPQALEIVVLAIMAEIPGKIKEMVPQALFNSLDSLILLQESVPEVVGFLGENGSQDAIAPSAAARLNTLLPKLTGQDLNVVVPAVVRACAKLVYAMMNY